MKRYGPGSEIFEAARIREETGDKTLPIKGLWTNHPVKDFVKAVMADASSTGGWCMVVCSCTGGRCMVVCSCTGGRCMVVCSCTGGRCMVLHSSTGGRCMVLHSSTGGRCMVLHSSTGGQCMVLHSCTGGRCMAVYVCMIVQGGRVSHAVFYVLFVQLRKCIYFTSSVKWLLY